MALRNFREKFKALINCRGSLGTDLPRSVVAVSNCTVRVMLMYTHFVAKEKYHYVIEPFNLQWLQYLPLGSERKISEFSPSNVSL